MMKLQLNNLQSLDPTPTNSSEKLQSSLKYKQIIEKEI